MIIIKPGDLNKIIYKGKCKECDCKFECFRPETISGPEGPMVLCPTCKILIVVTKK